MATVTFVCVCADDRPENLHPDLVAAGRHFKKPVFTVVPDATFSFSLPRSHHCLSLYFLPTIISRRSTNPIVLMAN